MAGKILRHKDNPFLEGLNINKVGKRVTVNVFGNDQNVLVNQETGEIKGTSVTTYRSVDDVQFVKLFSQNIAMTFDLTKSGIRAFNVLIYAVQSRVKSDVVNLDKYLLSDFIEEHKDLSPNIGMSEATFMRGLKELENAKIIAKTLRRGQYFINPSFIFNGDRIAFTSVIERKNVEKQMKNEAIERLSQNDIEEN